MSGPVIDPRRHDAVIFDLDGVVTDTAAVHAGAWKELFDRYLSRRPERDGEEHREFTDEDYRKFVDGKPRVDGVADFLASRGITLPWGDPDDGPDVETVCGLGARKDEMFRERIHRDGVPVFESSVDLVRRVQSLGLGTAVVTSSRNCTLVLEAAGLADLFGVRVDGVVSDELGLPGKPDPAAMLEAAHRLGVHPARSVVVEDAEAGVAAGRHGGFGLVVGVDRVHHRDELRRRGADVVVDDLAELVVRTGDRRMSEIPDALASLQQLTALLGTRRPAVFLDFDGTLSEIVNDPAAATLVDGAAAVLSSLASECTVAVISGRDLADVQTRVGLPGLWYAGSHGFELIGPDGQHQQNDAALAAVPYLERAAAALQERLADVPGAVIEHKRFTVAVHYRNVAPDREEGLVAAVHEVAAAEDHLRVTTGRKVVEIRPDVDWDKGRALEWVLEHVRDEDNPIPVYIGDDITDEDAFDALAGTGLGIVVRHTEDGDRRSAAQFSVDGPEQVRRLLQRLAELWGEDQEVGPRHDAWTLYFEGYDPPAEKLREAVCTVGNGYFATRGCAPESRAGAVHYPGTYAAGIFNRLTDEVAGRTIDNESMVNLPNWLPVTFRIDGGEWFDIDCVEVREYCQYLDLRRAVLTRRFRFRDGAGRTTTVVQRRFVAMHQPHVCGLETTIVPEDWSGRLEIRSEVDGAVRNTLVERYRHLAGDHLRLLHTARLSEDSVCLTVQTNQSRIPVAVAARSTLWRDDERIPAEYTLLDSGGRVGHIIALDVAAGEPVTLEKMATLFTGRDQAVSEPSEEATRWLARTGRFEETLEGHVLAWVHLWDRVDIFLGGDGEGLRIVRLHLLQMLQTLSPNTADLDVGVPARGLHGEAYRGHIFWDELFVLPVLNLRLPGLTRSLLRYRHRRLDEARRAAREAGHSGAMFPWQSGSDGREESQQVHLNPKSGRWNPDASWRQHHIGVAVAHNVWQYYQVTGDLGFLAEYGAEMLVEIARFFADLATYDRARDRYVIRGVIGPDEFHSGYPDAPFDGIDNNAYTNVMAVWVILRALEALEIIPLRIRTELVDTLGLTARETARWEDVSRRMFVPFHDQVISQFEGYGDLAELDWEGYRRRHGDIQRLDRLLEAEGDDVNRYRASKQADVLMLFYLLSADELRELFERLGYQLTGETIPRTIDYYMARTSHGSTLSAVVHSWVLARAHRGQAMEFFDRVLASDIADIQGGTTSEGIHLAAMAGSVDLLQRCFSGLEARGDRLVFGPEWPEELGALEFPIFYRGHHLQVRISGRQVEVSAGAGIQRPIEIECRGRVERLHPGDTVRML
ncbi:trehalose-phosphatase [Rhodococcus sp. WB1]|uniref:trehalose-phosphatase n=1 Tax=Rhodococcus sp. WB1 TaxID=1033922 RepID=UPI00081A2A23|nr:trehalose-phosphatase [Rhodococcus sp. WB1]ANZ28348.1 trehalose-phosphatase [Rhodococcus sp. WB1]